MAYTKSQHFVKLATVTLNGTLISSSDRLFVGSKSGTKVDGYRKAIASGGNAGSYYQADHYDLSGWTEGSVYTTFKEASDESTTEWTNKASGLLGYPAEVVHTATISDDMEAKVLSSLYKRIRAEQSAMNGQTVAGELRETIRMMRRPFQGVWQSIDGYTRQLAAAQKRIPNYRTSGRRAFLDLASSAWLEIAFGIKPLISDAVDLAKAVGRWEQEPPRRSRVSAVSKARSVSSSLGEPSGWNPGYVTFIVLASYTQKVSDASVHYKVGLSQKTQADFGSARRLVEILGFTPENFIPTLYELAPWSFLVDYATNLGSIVEAGTTDTSGVTWISRTEKQRTVQLDQQRSCNPRELLAAYGYKLSGWSGGAPLGSFTTIRTSLLRTIPVSLPIPPLVFSNPLENWGHTANILALIQQAKRRVGN